MRCVILDDYQQVALSYADWAVPGLEVEALAEHLPDEDAVVAALAGAAVAVVMRERTPLPRSVLSRLPDLRLVVSTGRRNPSIDQAAADELGIVVEHTPSLASPPGELTWALVLGLARRLATEDAAFRSGGPWQSTVGRDLAGSTLGLVGLGRIGAHVAGVARAFGMEVLAWSPHLTPERAAEVGAAPAADLVDLMSRSDWVSLHLVLGETTRGIVGREAIAAMKPSAYLVNTSRAGLVDTDALVEALEAGRIAGAGLDVFDVEPVPLEDRLRRIGTVLATPHLGYVTEGNYRTMYAEAAAAVRRFVDSAGHP